MSNFRPLEVVGRDSETQLQVGEKLKKITRKMNNVLSRFLHNHGNIATEGSPKPGLCPSLLLFRMTSRVLYSAQ